MVRCEEGRRLESDVMMSKRTCDVGHYEDNLQVVARNAQRLYASIALRNRAP